MILGVIGYTGYHYYGDQMQEWSKGAQGAQGAGGDKAPGDKSAGPAKPADTQVSKSDFSQLGKPGDPDRNKGVSGIRRGQRRAGQAGAHAGGGHQHLGRSHPGIVANGGLDAGAASSIYKSRYGLDVKFVLLEDPQAKLTAFIKGDIDIMWDTVDSWAREASTLAEQNIAAKAIIQQDWSRGGDGIVSLKTINSVEDLKGKTIATTRYTPSHWLLLYLLSQSGLHRRGQAQPSRRTSCSPPRRPLAAAAFKARRWTRR